jgi:hypothetical protein
VLHEFSPATAQERDSEEDGTLTHFFSHGGHRFWSLIMTRHLPVSSLKSYYRQLTTVTSTWQKTCFGHGTTPSRPKR